MTEDFSDFAAAAIPQLRRLAVALCGGDSSDADDLVQTTLERVWLAWPKRQIADPVAYAKKVLVRELATVRRRARWKRESLTADPPEHEITTDPVGRLADGLALVAALAKLPPRQRHTVVLRYLEDLSIAEVAALLKCSSGTVKRAAFDGLRSLEDTLEPSFERTI